MAEAYAAHVVPQNRTLVRRILELAVPNHGERVLDLGCGPGNLTLEAARLVGEAGRADGVDLAEGMIRIATWQATKQGLRNVEFHVMDCKRLSFPATAFGVVVSCLGIPSLWHRESFAEAYRVLQPGGRFVFCVGSGGGTGGEVGRAFREAMESKRPANPDEGVRRLLEARTVVNASGESSTTRDPDATVQALLGVGFAKARSTTEIHDALFADVDGYLNHQLAWGDNEREWRGMATPTREAFRRDFQDRIARFVRPDGFSYTREILFYVAAKG